MICPICDRNSTNVYKECISVPYHKCKKCKTIYTTQKINPLTENESSQTRNTTELNRIRFNRVNELLPNFKRVLDYGCGYGHLVSYMRMCGLTADGIDKTTELTLDKLQPEHYDAIYMVEVIEHLKDPKTIISKLETSLVSGGLIYIETTFADNADESYIDPSIGHITIISNKGIKLCLPNNMSLYKKINDNVILLRKE